MQVPTGTVAQVPSVEPDQITEPWKKGETYSFDYISPGSQAGDPIHGAVKGVEVEMVDAEGNVLPDEIVQIVSEDGQRRATFNFRALEDGVPEVVYFDCHSVERPFQPVEVKPTAEVAAGDYDTAEVDPKEIARALEELAQLAAEGKVSDEVVTYAEEHRDESLQILDREKTRIRKESASAPARPRGIPIAAVAARGTTDSDEEEPEEDEPSPTVPLPTRAPPTAPVDSDVPPELPAGAMKNLEDPDSDEGSEVERLAPRPMPAAARHGTDTTAEAAATVNGGKAAKAEPPDEAIGPPAMEETPVPAGPRSDVGSHGVKARTVPPRPPASVVRNGPDGATEKPPMARGATPAARPPRPVRPSRSDPPADPTNATGIFARGPSGLTPASPPPLTMAPPTGGPATAGGGAPAPPAPADSQPPTTADKKFLDQPTEDLLAPKGRIGRFLYFQIYRRVWPGWWRYSATTTDHGEGVSTIPPIWSNEVERTFFEDPVGWLMYRSIDDTHTREEQSRRRSPMDRKRKVLMVVGFTGVLVITATIVVVAAVVTVGGGTLAYRHWPWSPSPVLAKNDPPPEAPQLDDASSPLPPGEATVPAPNPPTEPAPQPTEPEPAPEPPTSPTANMPSTVAELPVACMMLLRNGSGVNTADGKPVLLCQDQSLFAAQGEEEFTRPNGSVGKKPTGPYLRLDADLQPAVDGP